MIVKKNEIAWPGITFTIQRGTEECNDISTENGLASMFR